MSSLTLRVLVVVGLSAGFASIACTDQSSEEVYEVREQETGQESERVAEDVSGDPEPAAEIEVVSEEERKELQEWMDEKLREAQEHEAEEEKEEKEEK